ncbi:MAG: hypothetical protein N2559_17090 [Anaerolineae bacterium]|nr:hypothetical protein [Anaerolineae bacterium]
MNETLVQQLSFVVTQRRQDEATVLAQALREGIKSLYRESIIEAYLLGQITREQALKELGTEEFEAIEYQRESLRRDIEWGLKNV